MELTSKTRQYQLYQSFVDAIRRNDFDSFQFLVRDMGLILDSNVLLTILNKCSWSNINFLIYYFDNSTKPVDISLSKSFTLQSIIDEEVLDTKLFAYLVSKDLVINEYVINQIKHDEYVQIINFILERKSMYYSMLDDNDKTTFSLKFL